MDSPQHSGLPSPDPVTTLLTAPEHLRPHLLASFRSEGISVDTTAHPALREAQDALDSWLERADHPEPMVACELDLAPALVDELLPLSLDDKIDRLEQEARFRRWGLAVHLLEEGYAHRFSQPRRCLRLSCLGLRVVRSLDSGYYGSDKVWELTTLALTRVANALRVCGELHPAAEFLRAAMSCAQTVSSHRIQAEVALATESLYRARHDPAAAQECLEQALLHLNRLSDPPESLLVCALIKSARRYGEQGRFGRAVGILRRLLPQIHDPLLRQVALDNLALFAQSSRDPDALADAQAMLGTNPKSPIATARVLTVLATRLDLTQDRRASEFAAAVFESAGDLLARPLPLAAALAYLDAARIYARHGSARRLGSITHKASFLQGEKVLPETRQSLRHLAGTAATFPRLVTESIVADLRHHVLVRPFDPWEEPSPAASPPASPASRPRATEARPASALS